MSITARSITQKSPASTGISTDLSPKLVIMFGNDEHPRHLIT